MLDEMLQLLFVWGVCGCVMMLVHQYFGWWKHWYVCGLFGLVFAYLVGIVIALPYWLLVGGAMAFALALLWVGRHPSPHYKLRQIIFDAQFEAIEFEEVTQ
jgi:hypothetical protein